VNRLKTSGQEQNRHPDDRRAKTIQASPPLTAAEVAQTLGVKVYTIGIGIRGKAPYPVIDQYGQKRYQYMDVMWTRKTLGKIAQMTTQILSRGQRGHAAKNLPGNRPAGKNGKSCQQYQHYDELFGTGSGGVVGFAPGDVLAHTVWRKLP